MSSQSGRTDGGLDLLPLRAGPGQHRHSNPFEHLFGPFPGRQTAGSIGAEDQDDLLRPIESPKRVDRVGPAIAVDLAVVGYEVRDSRRGNLRHAPTMLGGADLAVGLLPGRAGRQIDDPVKPELAVGDLSGQKVGDMGRVEGSSE